MDQTPRQGAPCPLCGKPALHGTRPFCSRRCADIDLGRWLKGVYRVPTEEPPDLETEETPDPEAEGDDA